MFLVSLSAPETGIPRGHCNAWTLTSYATEIINQLHPLVYMSTEILIKRVVAVSTQRTREHFTHAVQSELDCYQGVMGKS